MLSSKNYVLHKNLSVQICIEQPFKFEFIKKVTVLRILLEFIVRHIFEDSSVLSLIKTGTILNNNL